MPPTLAPFTPASPDTDRPRGFTLLELLVSVSILVVMVTFMGYMLSHASHIWALGAGNAGRMDNLRAINETISKELRSALLPLDRTSQKNLQFLVNPAVSNIGVTPSSYNGDTIFWQAPMATSQTYGDAAEIGYFVKWDWTKPNNPRSILCRFFVNPDGNSVTNAVAESSYLIYSQPTTWISDSIIASAAPATASVQAPAQPYQGFFAQDVLGLWITCRDNFGNQIVSDFNKVSLQVPSSSNQYGFDSRRGYSFTDPNVGGIATSPGYVTPSGSGAGSLLPLCSLPPQVDIGTVMIDSQAAVRVNPTMQAQIATLLTTSTTAAVFISKAATTSRLAPIYSSMRAYQTTVYLRGSE